YFTVSLIAGLFFELVEIKNFAMVINYGLNKVRFPAPLKEGQRYRLNVKLGDVTEVPNGVEGLLAASIEIEGEQKPSCVAELGFRGSDEEVLAQAARDPELKDQLLRISSSAAAMWTANAASCIPSADAADGRLHLIPANLAAMFHRSLEAETTARVLRAIFADAKRFEVHDPLPGGVQFADEGAANHVRLLAPDRPAVQVFAWGRRAFGGPPAA